MLIDQLNSKYSLGHCLGIRNIGGVFYFVLFCFGMCVCGCSKKINLGNITTIL